MAFVDGFVLRTFSHTLTGFEDLGGVSVVVVIYGGGSCHRRELLGVELDVVHL